jgi:hypothetical protein
MIGEYGARGIEEFGLAGIAPASGATVHHATGVRIGSFRYAWKTCSNAESAQDLPGQYCLSGMKGHVIGPADHDCKPVARGVFDKILFGNRRMFLQPFRRGKALKRCCEPGVYFRPGFLQIRSRNRVRQCSVRICYIGLVKLRVKPFSNAQQGEHAIMHGGQMAQKIEQSILARSNLLLQLLFTEIREALVEAANHQLPGVKRSNGEKFFLVQCTLLFPRIKNHTRLMRRKTAGCSFIDRDALSDRLIFMAYGVSSKMVQNSLIHTSTRGFRKLTSFRVAWVARTIGDSELCTANGCATWRAACSGLW